MAIRVLYPGVGESDIIQPGSKTNIVWDFTDLLVDEEVVKSAVIVIVNRADEVVDNIAGDAIIADGNKTESVVEVPLSGLVDGERYKIMITATIKDEKIAVVTVFVPVVAP